MQPLSDYYLPPIALKERNITESKRSFLVALKPKCVICNKQHLIIECDIFQAKPVRNRAAFICQHRLCPNYFNTGHTAYQYRSHKVCKVCSRKHHTLTHFETNQPNTDKQTKWLSKTKPSKQSDPSKAKLNPSIIYPMQHVYRQ